MRTIIFLDFDGVLNGASDYLDGPCVEAFGHMLEMAPTAEIVVSSTWRLWRPLPDLAAMLRPFGLDVSFSGSTPVAHSQKMTAHTAYVNGGARMPLPPADLVDARQEPIHRDPGGRRPARVARPLGELPAYPEFQWDWLDGPPPSEWMGRFRVSERQRMDDYAARRDGGGMYA